MPDGSHLSFVVGQFGSEVSLDQPGEPETFLPLLVIVGGTVFSLWFLYNGLSSLSRAGRVLEGDPVDAGSFHLEDGIVELEGTAEPIDGTVTGKYSSEEALAYTYRKEREHHEHGDGDETNTSEWRTVDQGDEAIPFEVADETGSVVVDPDGADLTLDEERMGGVVGDVRTYEGRLEPGGTVYVNGKKVEATEKGDEFADVKSYLGGGEDLVVSDTTENWTAMRYGARGVGEVVVAAVALLVAGFVLARVLGVPTPV